MPLRDDLLTPIPGDSRGGVNLRNDPLFDRVKEARREDPDLPTGDGPPAERKLADYAAAQRLAGEALATRSKDLWLAAWLTEALLRREGIDGLTQGLGLLRDLLVQYWDCLYPALEPEEEGAEAELRAAPLDWVGSKLVLAVREVPLTRAGHAHVAFVESREVGYELAARESEEKTRRRNERIAEGKLAAEEWDRAVEATPLPFYQTLDAGLAAALETLQALDAVSQEKFGAQAPSYTPLRETLEQVHLVVRAVVAKRLPPEPEPGAEAEGGAGGDGAGAGLAGDGVGPGARRRGAGGPSLLEQATAEVRAGRPARAVDLLMSAANRGRSRRDRFIRRTAVARIMVDAGLFPVAVPLLEQLLAEIQEFRLEEWEPGAVVAAPMALLWRCYQRTGNEREMEPLYLRICRLDPVQAIALTPPGS
jgi:type VI secretion system protein ImpA